MKLDLLKKDVNISWTSKINRYDILKHFIKNAKRIYQGSVTIFNTDVWKVAVW